MQKCKAEKPTIAVIGGMEIFIENRPQGQLQFGDENPGQISVGCQGKIWNLVVGLIDQGCKVNFISVAGNDFPGQALKAQIAQKGVSVEHFYLIDGKDTAAKHAVLNLLDQPEMEFQNDEVFQSLTKELIDLAAPQIALSDCIVLDTYFSAETIQHIGMTFPQIPILLCPESPQNAMNGKPIINSIEGILVGRREAELISGLEILSEDQLFAAGQWFLGKGISQIFLYLGQGGIFFTDEKSEGLQRPGPANLSAIVQGFACGKTAKDIAIQSIRKVGESDVESKESK